MCTRFFCLYKFVVFWTAALQVMLAGWSHLLAAFPLLQTLKDFHPRQGAAPPVCFHTHCLVPWVKAHRTCICVHFTFLTVVWCFALFPRALSITLMQAGVMHILWCCGQQSSPPVQQEFGIFAFHPFFLFGTIESWGWFKPAIGWCLLIQNGQGWTWSSGFKVWVIH